VYYEVTGNCYLEGPAVVLNYMWSGCLSLSIRGSQTVNMLLEPKFTLQVLIPRDAPGHMPYDVIAG